MFADYHVHSYFSEDTDFPMELEIQKAIELGMDELCFTEHSDYDEVFCEQAPNSFSSSFLSLLRLPIYAPR